MIDSADAVDTTTTSTADTATADTGPVTTDTQSQATPSAEGTEVHQDQSEQDSNPVNDGSSPTTLNTTPQNIQKSAPQPADDWKTRYSELRSYQTKQAEKLKEYEQRWKQHEDSQRKSEDAAKQANIPPWNPRHPSHGKWNQTWTKYQTYQQQLNNAASMEEKQAVAKNWQGVFQPFEVDLVRQHEQERQEFNDNFHADPQQAVMGMIGDEVTRRVEEVLRTREVQMQASNDVDAWTSDPRNQTIMQQYGQEMLQRMNAGEKWSTVKELYAMRAQLSALQGRVGEADAIKTSADERDRLVKSRASINRDPNSTKQVDPMLVAKERGIKPGTPAYLDLLLQLQSEGNIQ